MSDTTLATTEPQAMNLAAISERILSGELTPEKLTMIKELVAMDAERQFNTSFSALQSDMPEIVASTIIPNRGKYERFEDVMHAIRPLLTKHGFSVSFDQAFGEKRVTETCTLSHIGGHKRLSSFAVGMARADSETQADVKASTTAKRKALQDALNIVIRQDCLDDEENAAMQGGPISEDEAKELQRRVKACGGNEQRFLRLGGVILREDDGQIEHATQYHYEQIPSGKLQTLLDFLERKEKSK